MRLQEASQYGAKFLAVMEGQALEVAHVQAHVAMRRAHAVEAVQMCGSKPDMALVHARAAEAMLDKEIALMHTMFGRDSRRSRLYRMYMWADCNPLLRVIQIVHENATKSDTSGSGTGGGEGSGEGSSGKGSGKAAGPPSAAAYEGASGTADAADSEASSGDATAVVAPDLSSYPFLRELDRRCHFCWLVGEKGRPLALCSRCKAAKYCSAECQHADWPAHKQHCRAVVAARAAEPKVKVEEATGAGGDGASEAAAGAGDAGDGGEGGRAEVGPCGRAVLLMAPKRRSKYWEAFPGM